MKTPISGAFHFALVGAVLSLITHAACAQETSATTTQTAPAQPAVTTSTPAAASGTVTIGASDSAAVKLPYGVADVLKLSQAQVGEDIVLSYIHNSGTIYSLTPNDIVYLRNAGVSDRIIGAMLDQRQAVEGANQAATAAAIAAAASAPQPTYPQPTYAPTYSQPAPTEVATSDTQSAASSVYVIPYPAATAAYYGYPGYYYGGYSYYGWPAVSLGFTFGNYGCYRGGPYYYGSGYYHGGGYYGGGYHGGYNHGGYNHGGGYYRGGYTTGGARH